MALGLTFQVPAPSEIGVDRDSGIAFQVVVTAAPDFPNYLTLNVDVQENGGGYVPAIVNGVIQPPFDAAGGAVIPISDTVLAAFRRHTIFGATVVVDVRVNIDGTGGSMPQADYSFTTKASLPGNIALVQLATGTA